MKGKNLFNTTPIKMIRTIKGITVNKMAYYFEVGQAYITMIENEERSFKIQTLKNGLNNLGVTMEQYNEITEFREFLEKKQLDEKDKYKYMLMKTIGVLTPDIKEEIDEVLNNTLSTKIK